MNKFEAGTMHYANPTREIYEVIKDIAKMMIEKSCHMKILYGGCEIG